MNDEEDDDHGTLAERELTEGVTERTIAALRKLAKEGLISREQKRRLLVIICEYVYLYVHMYIYMYVF